MNLQLRISEAIQESGSPAAVVAYSVGGEVFEASAGVLNLDTRVEATVDSVFQIGSVTKPWTAALVQQLVDEGAVALDEPIRTYLPDLAVPDEAHASSLTIRNLLRHAGGFAGDYLTDHGRGDDALGQTVAALRDRLVIAPPGELFSYCNAGYALLGHLTATLRGSSWEQAMRRYLIEPLGLERVALFPEEALLFRTAVGHVASPGGALRTTAWARPRATGPAGAVCTTARTVLDFARVFMTGGRPGVISAEAVKRGWEPQIGVPGGGGLLPTRWGQGWMLYDWHGTTVIGHDGDTVGQHARLRIIPEADFAIVVLTNGGALPRLYDRVLYPLVEELTGIRVPAAPTPPASRSHVDAARYVGDYADPHGTIRVETTTAGLRVIEEPDEAGIELGAVATDGAFVHLRDDTFVKSEPDAGRHRTVSFTVDGEQATHLHAYLRANPRAT